MAAKIAKEEEVHWILLQT